MRPFEYASPRTEAEAVEMLSAHDGQTAVLSGGTDLMTLLKRDVIQPKRVVDIKNIDSLKGITRTDDGVLVGEGAHDDVCELRERRRHAGVHRCRPRLATLEAGAANVLEKDADRAVENR